MIASFLIAAALPAIQSGGTGSLSPNRVAVTAKINTRGLDLRTVEGRRHFRARVAVAAHQACGAYPKELALAVDVIRCIEHVRADGARQLAAMTADPVGTAKP